MSVLDHSALCTLFVYIIIVHLRCIMCNDNNYVNLGLCSYQEFHIKLSNYL
jgi:hypothetical protein